MSVSSPKNSAGRTVAEGSASREEVKAVRDRIWDRFEEGYVEMRKLQEQGEPGGQLIYPLVDETWQRQADRVQMVDQLLAGTGRTLAPDELLALLQPTAGAE